MSGAPRVLLVDDEPLFLETLERILSREGMHVVTATSADEALHAIEHNTIDVALVDIVMPGMDGLELLQRLRERSHPPEIVMLTAHATVDTAVDAMKRGAYDYLQKPADVSDIERVLRKAWDKSRLARENRSLKSLLSRHDPHGTIVGDSPEMTHLRDLVARVAVTDSTALILGESGVGKELVARRLHALGRRSGSQFLTINCGAIRSSLLENELFGHVSGAFTGATGTARGLFEEADGGTLFIDEVGEMALEVQAALLQVLETGEFKRLGEARTRSADVRVIAATNRDLHAAVATGDFRKDLFYRLNVVTIEIPPLRDHRADIPALCTHLLTRLEPDRDSPRRIAVNAARRLAAHTWPGNVRELRNALERAVIMSLGDDLEEEAFPPLRAGDEPSAAPAPAPSNVPREQRQGVPAVQSLAEMERDLIVRALDVSAGNKTTAARLLGVSLRALYTRLRRYGL